VVLKRAATDAPGLPARKKVGRAAAPQPQSDTNGESVSQDLATHVRPDELRSSRVSAIAALVARYALVIVITWFGAMKFTYYESQGISPLVANSPFMSWLYDVMSIRTFGRLLGSLELLTAVLLALKPWLPKASVLGGVIASLFFVSTLSFMITTPGIGESSAGGFPVLSANGQFLVKDIALLGLSLWLLADAIDASRKQPMTATKRSGNRY
jgi:reactive chlorine resistance protein C